MIPSVTRPTPVSLLALASVASVASFAVAGCHKAKTEAPLVAAPEVHVHVDTALVTDKVVPKLLSLTGTLDGDQRTELSANASGRVVKTFVERGQTVARGALLAQLDSRSAVITQAQVQAQAVSAETQAGAAKADCERYENLIKKGAITQQEYDKATWQCRTTSASYDAAQAKTREAAQAIGDSTIRAPFAGTIAERFVNVGDYVRQDSRVVTLLVADPLRLKITVPEPSLAFVKQDAPVSFETLSAPGKTFTATLKYIGREIREKTRDLVVEALVPNPDGLLFPGMFVTAHLPTGTVTSLVVPTSALVDTGLSKAVFVVVEKHIQQRLVQPGVVDGADTAITTGLQKGERIVTNPSPQTVDGAIAD